MIKPLVNPTSKANVTKRAANCLPLSDNNAETEVISTAKKSIKNIILIAPPLQKAPKLEVVTTSSRVE
jgi:hypothetical protein